MTSRDAKQWACGAVPLVAPETLNDILAAASDLSIVISDMGHVLSVLVNPSHPSFGKLEDWVDRDIRETLTTESVPKFDARLAEFLRGTPTIRPVELNHHGAAGMDFPVRYTFHRIGPDGTILMMGRDLRAVAEMQQQLVEAQLALERDYEAQREIATRMRVLLETIGEAIVFVRLSDGRICEINGTAARLLGGRVSELGGTLFAAELSGAHGDAIAGLVDAARADGGDETVVLTARRTARTVAVRPTLFRAAGERMMLCRLEAAQARGCDPEAGDTAWLEGLYARGVDAMLFTDRGGRIVSVNDAFLGLLDLENAAAVRGRNLSDFLLRGGVDLKVLVNNAVRSGQMKLFATRMVSDYGDERAVEIAATFLADDEVPSLGYVIRPTGRAEGGRGAAGSTADEGMHSARELVGAASLKEIVAETSDVVEKMCIETAVELTGNNRVAAAEMLGLSRQSLYVKLRKYDLLARHKT